jgi:hypothetical protein
MVTDMEENIEEEPPHVALWNVAKTMQMPGEVGVLLHQLATVADRYFVCIGELQEEAESVTDK